MDYIYDVFMNFLKLESFGWMDFQWRDRNRSGFYKNILICVNQVWNNKRVSKWWPNVHFWGKLSQG